MSDPTNDDLAQVYDSWYRQAGAAHWEHAPGKAVLIEALSRLASPGRSLRLLDVGCGSGSFLARIRLEVSPHWQLAGVDFSAVAIEEGRRQFPGLELDCADATALDHADAAFDVVLCYGSWEHFPAPEKAIAEAARVLAPGGLLLAMIPALGVHRTDRDDEGWYEDTEVAGSERRQLQWNLRRSTWAAMFEAAGVHLFEASLAAACGARKPGVFFFGVKAQAARVLATGAVASGLFELSRLAERLAPRLEMEVLAAVGHLAACLAGGGKILVCGNGGSAADAQHFVAELVGRMRRERRALPALALSSDPSVVTALGNDYGYERVFARQVEAWGGPGDVLLAISTSGRSRNVLEALAVAQARGLVTLALLGQGGDDPALAACTMQLRVPSPDTQRVQELHGAILHALCDGVEQGL